MLVLPASFWMFGSRRHIRWPKAGSGLVRVWAQNMSFPELMVSIACSNHSHAAPMGCDTLRAISSSHSKSRSTSTSSSLAALVANERQDQVGQRNNFCRSFAQACKLQARRPACAECEEAIERYEWAARCSECFQLVHWRCGWNCANCADFICGSCQSSHSC